ncbi:MAG: hypothetical protein R2878_00915 [Thermoleophilia bacterium]
MTTRTLALLALLGTAAVALAAPPANDDRNAAEPIGVAATVRGTTVDATRDDTDPFAFCRLVLGPSVWYRIDSPAPGRIALEVQSAEGAGLAVAVFRRTAGDLTPEVCATTSDRGNGAAFFTAAPRGRYLVQVASGVRADPGRFVLRTFRPEPLPKIPGPALPARGATGTVDVVRDTEDAFSLVMRAGTTYRINLSTGTAADCRVGLRILERGATSLDADTVVRARCGGYVTYTPGPEESGRYSLVVTGNRNARRARYRLQAAPLAADDQAPGLPLLAGGQRRGSVSARGIDRLDLHRFTVTHRSLETVRLLTSGDIALRLMRPNGRTIACACESGGGSREIERNLAPGEYLVSVRANDGGAGRYRLLRMERTITSSVLATGSSTIDRSQTVTLRLAVSPAPDRGSVLVDAFQFDPLDGWRFRTRLRGSVRGGAASFTYRPTGSGPWRFRGEYRGSRAFSPSTARTLRISVQP